MVVGVNRFFGSLFKTEDFVCPVCNDFVNVHIALGSASGHPHFEGELGIIITVQDLIAGGDHCRRECFFQFSGGCIDCCCRLFNQDESVDNFNRDQLIADIEVDNGTLSLRSPIFFCRDFNLSHAVCFSSE